MDKAKDNSALSTKIEQFSDWYRREKQSLLFLGLAGFANAGSEAAAFLGLISAISAIGEQKSVISLRALPALGGPIEIPVGAMLSVSLAFLALRLAVLLVSASYTARVLSCYEARVRTRVFESFVRANWGFQRRESSGRLHASLSVSIERTGQILNATTKLLASTASGLILIVSAFVVDWRGALAVLAIAAATLFALRSVSRSAAASSLEQTRINKRFAAIVSESVVLSRDYRVNDVVETVVGDFARTAEENARAVRTSWFLRDATPALYQGVASIAIVVALMALHVVGVENIAPIVAVVLLSIRAFSYGQLLQSYLHRIVEMWPYLDDLHSALSTYEANAARFGDRQMDRLDRLEFENVSYAYDPGKPVLEDVSFEIRRGESLGVMGPSGGGKSTLVQLALGLFRPTAGRVLANGMDTMLYSSSAWFTRIGYVPQEPHLFRGSIAENIRFFRAGISDDAIRDAARRAGLLMEIEAMPEGFETDVGETGGRLSGGQRQRLVIARALASAPDLLVMDEPTSALDFEADAVVKRTLAEVKGEIGVLVVAHRIATLEDCDRALVMHAGRIVETGTPSTLAKSNAYYQRAVSAQGC